MKIKPIYLYISLFIVAVLIIIIVDPTSNQNSKSVTNTNPNSGQMPNDEIHKGMNGMGSGDQPSAGNVSESFKQKMAELENYVTENPEDTAKVKEYAELLSAAHKPDESIKFYESILDKDQSRVDVLMPLIYLEYTKRNLDKAENYTNQVLKLDPNNAQAHYNLGAIEATRGNTNRAKEIWEMVKTKYPNTEAAHIAEQSLKQL